MRLKLYEPHRSLLGISANWIAALIYIVPGILGIIIPSISSFTFLLPIILYLVERTSKLVRFHCLQYILMSLFSSCVMYALYLLCLLSDSLIMIAYAISQLFSLIMFALLLYSMYKAFLWRSWRVPILGDLSSKIVKEEIES